MPTNGMFQTLQFFYHSKHVHAAFLPTADAEPPDKFFDTYITTIIGVEEFKKDDGVLQKQIEPELLDMVMVLTVPLNLFQVIDLQTSIVCVPVEKGHALFDPFFPFPYALYGKRHVVHRMLSCLINRHGYDDICNDKHRQEYVHAETQSEDWVYLEHWI